MSDRGAIGRLSIDYQNSRICAESSSAPATDLRPIFRTGNGSVLRFASAFAWTEIDFAEDFEQAKTLGL